jgi:enoyl-CoA hydratase/carnithine racemase
MTDQILYSAAEGVATITLNRPDRMNAMLPGMGELYADLLQRADADPEVRVIVVTGAGKGFCSGADLSVLAEGTSGLNKYVDEQSAETLPFRALMIGTPVVTAINGACAGIGFVLAACADLRIIGSGVRMSTTFSRLGLVAEYGIAWLLPRLVGYGNATELLLSGRAIDANEALRIGLVNEISEDPLTRALEWARELADNCSPSAMAAMKGQLLRVAEQSLTQAVDESLAMMKVSFALPDLAEALAAKGDKRAVNFPPRGA